MEGGRHRMALACYAVSLAVSLAVFAFGMRVNSPSISGMSFIAAIESALFIFGSLKLKKDVKIVIPIGIAISLGASVLFSELFDFGFYYGFQTGELAIPMLSFGIICMLIGYCNLRTYRELIVTFQIFGCCAMANVVAVFTYALCEADLDAGVTNLAVIQALAFGLVLGLISGLVFQLYSKFVDDERYYTEPYVLEGSE
jgi:hypothetical protein